MSIPSRSFSNSLRWVWLAPEYLVRAKLTTSHATASGVALGTLRLRCPWATAAAPFSRLVAGRLQRLSATNSSLIAASLHACYHSALFEYQFLRYLSAAIAASLHTICVAGEYGVIVHSRKLMV